MRLTLLAIVLVTAVGCSLGPPRMKVGSQVITERDIELQQGVIKVYYPGYNGNLREAAIKRLVDSLTRLEVMKNNGWEITARDVEAEAARIDKETLMPEKLQQIKSVFGDDHKAYLNWFVRPVLTERTLEPILYQSDRRVHTKAIAEAEKFLAEALQTGKAFKALEKSGNPVIEKYEISETAGVYRGAIPSRQSRQPRIDPKTAMPENIQARLESQARTDGATVAKRWVDEVLSRLKVGEVHRGVIDHGRELWVIKLVSIRQGRVPVYTIEAARFTKADFVKWYDAEKRKVAVSLPQ